MADVNSSAGDEQRGQKVFLLRDTRDLLKKLRFELQQMSLTARHDVEARAYHAFNCAITAWHVTDWLWHDMPLEVRKQVSDPPPEQNGSLQDFQNYTRKDCPALALCYQIATGSKHCRMKNTRADASVAAGVSEGEEYEYGNPVILIGDEAQDAQRVFYVALCWYERFMKQWNILPEEPFIPHSDDPSRTENERLRQVRPSEK